MNCPICAGDLQKKAVNICACDVLPAIIVTGIPALVCVLCEERVLTQETMDLFRQIRLGHAPAPIHQTSRLYPYSVVQQYLMNKRSSVLVESTASLSDTTGIPIQAQVAMLSV